MGKFRGSGVQVQARVQVHMKVTLDGFVYCLCHIHPAANVVLTVDKEKITCEKCIYILELDMNHFD